MEPKFEKYDNKNALRQLALVALDCLFQAGYIKVCELCCEYVLPS